MSEKRMALVVDGVVENLVIVSNDFDYVPTTGFLVDLTEVTEPVSVDWQLIGDEWVAPAQPEVLEEGS